MENARPKRLLLGARARVRRHLRLAPSKGIAINLLWQPLANDPPTPGNRPLQCHDRHSLPALRVSALSPRAPIPPSGKRFQRSLILRYRCDRHVRHQGCFTNVFNSIEPQLRAQPLCQDAHKRVQ